jgi:hypothetical protein
LPKIDPLYDYFKVIARKQKYTYEEAKIMGANSLVELPRIDKRPVSVITTVPLGFFYALVQPTPLQSHGKAIVFINGVENLLFVVAIRIPFIEDTKAGRRASPIILVSLFYCCRLFIIYRLVGTCVREYGTL